VPSVDVTESEKEIEITAELPGLEEKDVQINVSDGLLTIKGEKKSEKEEKDKNKNYRLVERSYGSFSRTLELPAGVDPDAIKATIDKGVLTVIVPKPAPAETRKIEVKAAA
jgi:HSP20 family protein